MKKLFFALFSFPLICFGQTADEPSANLLSYSGIIVGVLAVLSTLLCIYLFFKIAGLKTKLDRLLLAEKVRRDSELIKKEREERQDTVIKNPFNEEIVRRAPSQETTAKDAPNKEKEGTGFVTLSIWERAFDDLNMRVLALEDPKLGKQLFEEEIVIVADPEGIISANGLHEQHHYAKMPGSDGRFNEEEFLNQQNGEQIYELKLKENEGIFKISDNTQAQIYALSDIGSYLESACDFPAPPDRNSRIVTITLGTVHKQGSQWLIIDKAKIEFE